MEQSADWMSYSQTVLSAFLQRRGKTRITQVEYPMEMDLLGLLVLEKSG